jgi:predicted phage terminase large subunit-like protein
VTEAAADKNPLFDPYELAKLPEEKIVALLNAANRRIAASRSREKIIQFARFMRPDPNHPGDPEHSRYSVEPHHNLLGDLLHDVFTLKTQNVCISMPPQHGKSDICSRLGLAYHTGKYPWRHVLFGTYNQTFAEEYGDDVRTLLNQDEYRLVFPRVRLRTGSKAKDHMVTEDGGKLSFIGRGGSGTGRPADGMLIDDPIKDAAEAESMTIRNQVWNWFVRVMSTRCHIHSWKIIIQTRWHEDDLIGRLTDPTNPYYNEEVSKKWVYINIPALMDNAEIAAALNKQLGDALWPERFPKELLENMRRMDPVAFSALYMGRPTPPEGAFYKQFHLKGYEQKDLPPLKTMRFYMTGDLAVSPEKHADKSAVGVWGLDPKDELWLLPELYWDRKSSDESVERIIQLGKQYGVFEAFFEKGQLDRAIGPFLEKRMQEEKVYFPITRMPVAGNKGTRSLSIRGRMAQGKVHFPVFAPWWAAAKDQMLKFTGSGDDKEDDFCDMLALIGQALDDQIAGDAPQDEKKSNVIRVGTLAWVKAAHNAEQQRQRRQRMLARA